MNQTDNKYNLEERTACFAEEVVRFCKTLTETSISKPIILQLIRSATSIGANYMEANGASSKKDFANKIFICKKESQETKYWLRILKVSYPKLADEIAILEKEVQELILIFNKIAFTLRNGK